MRLLVYSLLLVLATLYFQDGPHPAAAQQITRPQQYSVAEYVEVIAQQSKLQHANSPMVIDGVTMLNFDIKSLPNDLKYRGRIVMGAKWVDRNGENILILTQTGAFPSRGECVYSGGCSDVGVYAYHFVRNRSSLSLLWRTTDFQRDCPFDLYAGYLDKPFLLQTWIQTGWLRAPFCINFRAEAM